jgi:hypothetical protein
MDRLIPILTPISSRWAVTLMDGDRFPESVVINDFYAKTGACEGAEHCEQPLIQLQSVQYRQTPIFRHPFFIKQQFFSLKYSLVSPPQNFSRYV